MPRRLGSIFVFLISFSALPGCAFRAADLAPMAALEVVATGAQYYAGGKKTRRIFQPGLYTFCGEKGYLCDPQNSGSPYYYFEFRPDGTGCYIFNGKREPLFTFNWFVQGPSARLITHGNALVPPNLEVIFAYQRRGVYLVNKPEIYYFVYDRGLNKKQPSTPPPSPH